jgi:hypothetical protein
MGIVHRLENNKQENLEDGFPDSSVFKLNSESGTETLRMRVYAFKKGADRRYLDREGVVFSINGQAHGRLPRTLFSRAAVKLGRIGRSIFIYIDCSDLSARARELLFMPSRDRLRSGTLRGQLERTIERIVSKHDGLRALSEQRAREEIEERTKDNAQLQSALETIIRRSPTLASLLVMGQRIRNPLKAREVAEENKTWTGKRYPTVFKFPQVEYGKKYERSLPMDNRCRLILDTDAENTYFSRDEYPGGSTVRLITGQKAFENYGHDISLRNGRANVTLEMPDALVVGDKVQVEITISDGTLAEPFENKAEISITPAASSGGGSSNGIKPPSDQAGKGRNQPAGLGMPDVVPVAKEKWSDHDMNEFSVCRVVLDQTDDENQDKLTFYVNIDNSYLLSEQKASSSAADIAKHQFVHGSVLIGMAIIYDDKKSKPADDNASQVPDQDISVEDTVKNVTRAMGPFLVPLIGALGNVTLEDLTLAGVGDDE